VSLRIVQTDAAYERDTGTGSCCPTFEVFHEINMEKERTDAPSRPETFVANAGFIAQVIGSRSAFFRPSPSPKISKEAADAYLASEANAAVPSARTRKRPGIDTFI
jgi:hypothetical protein